MADACWICSRESARAPAGVQHPPHPERKPEPQSQSEPAGPRGSTATLTGVVVWVHKHCGRQAFIAPFLDGSGQGPEMMALRGGRFEMGYDGYAKDEKPVHEVDIADFAIAVTPVTHAQYEAFLDAEGERVELDPATQDLPAVGLSFDAAERYCRWLSDRTGAVYRLPTEAEWEYACRAGSTTPWSFGDDSAALVRHGWCAENARGSGPRAVRSLSSNPWGLHDMHGNVLEWCRDWYTPSYWSQALPRSAVDAADHGQFRTLRGGIFRSPADDCRCASRDGERPQYRGNHIGFRVARGL
jgi:formylglycine-generating enzyme required for sulfatase activity